MSDITPSIGRKVWFYPDETCIQSLAATRENDLPFDATIISVHDDDTVNLAVHDHVGHHFAKLSVPLFAPGEAPEVQGGCYAAWTPYQVAQATPTPEAPEAPKRADKKAAAEFAAADLAGEARP